MQDGAGHVIGRFFGTGVFGPYTLPSSGSYAFVINGDGSTATGTVALYGFTEHTVPIHVNGGARGVRSDPLQTTKFTFPGQAGQTVAIELRPRAPRHDSTNVNLFPTATLRDPSGQPLPVSGTYTLSESGVYTVSVTPSTRLDYRLSVTAPPDPAAGTLEVNGPIAIATITDSHTPVSLTFAGQAGERVAVQSGLLDIIGPISFGPNPPSISLLDPSGAVLTSAGLLSGGIAPLTLPTDGTYTIVINPGPGPE